MSVLGELTARRDGPPPFLVQLLPAVNAQSQPVDYTTPNGTQRFGLWEMALIFALLFVYAGSPPPDANEAHYLIKARHYWNPQWCGPDVFLDSRDAHTVFYWTIGWLTCWLSLSTVAWIGRLASWALFAVAWQRLSWTIVPRRYVSILTAALFLILTDYAHLAGEWAVGGLEAKPIAYVFLLFALRALVADRWRSVWVWLGAASAFHVLVGGWSVIATAIAWLTWGRGRPPLRSMWPSMMVGLLLALPGLIPAIMLSAGTDAAVARQANEIYVFGRLAHHLVFHRFAPVRLVAFGGLLAAWFLAWRTVRGSLPWSRLNRFALGSLGIALAGAAIDLTLMAFPALAATLLKYYWFRLSDIAIPLAVAMAVPLAIVRWEQEPPTVERVARRRTLWSARLAWGAVVLAATLLLTCRFAGRQIDFRPGAVVQTHPAHGGSIARARRRFQAWRDACTWIAGNTDRQARFLTPRSQQTFTWYAQRAEVACWKNIPQDPSSIVSWWHTLHDIYPPEIVAAGITAWSDERLEQLASRYDFDYILVDRKHATRRLGHPRFELVYPDLGVPNGYFEVYRVRRADPPTQAGTDVSAPVAAGLPERTTRP